MTEPHHEPSYYEIALTNRQVVVAFVVLLVCLLAAFFSGVWIGRGSAERNAGEPQVARVAPPPEPTEGRNLEELKFFSEESGSKRRGKGRGDAATAGAPSSAPSPAPPTPANTASGAADETASAPPPARRPPPTPPAPEPEESAPAPAAPPPARHRAPAPAAVPARPADRVASGGDSSAADSGAVVRSRRLPEEAAPRDSDAAAGRAAAQPGGGSTVIQVFASADSNEARKVRDRLARGGERAFLSPLTVDGRTMYRVRVGPFASRSLAQKEADRVRRSYKLDTWLTE